MNKTLRKTIIAGNWKMNLLLPDIRPFADTLLYAFPNIKSIPAKAVICAPALFLGSLAEAFAFSEVSTGGQDVSAFNSGAYTGEISAVQLAGFNVEYCIVGHSERRQYHAETNELIAEKTLRCLENGITPIVCVGETLEQREAGQTFTLIGKQVSAVLNALTEEQAGKIVFAYEPIWAIGTGKTATAEQAEKVCGAIRNRIAKRYDDEKACGISILYGGSMNDKNAVELLSQPDIDGGLIGGASLDPVKFAAIISAVETAGTRV
ncbi:MAG: triose-phosphate isomerase [Oscillospiraceae bacterium]|jgi:triosephosphate isomerase|nr:triose-phosphate isomerase [Oscillospiraceae bacterium]